MTAEFAVATLGMARPDHVSHERVVHFDIYNPTGERENVHGAWKGLQTSDAPDIIVLTMLHGLDDRENEHPMEVNFGRTTTAHSTFGNGVHRCAGADLARLEIRILLEEWMRRIPKFTVDPNSKVTFSSGIIGAVDQLPLVWYPKTTREVG